LDSWQIPVADRHRDGILQFSAEGKYLVYTDGYIVEHWAASPRSWIKSSLWAGGGTLVLLAPIALWRFWRGRKRATISTSAPPFVPSELAKNEIFDAKT